MRIRPLLIFALAICCLTACNKPQREPEAAWEYADPESVGLDSRKLHAAMDMLGPDAGNIVVVAGGKVIYSKGDITAGMPLFSASKSLLALIYATLVQNGTLHLDTAFPDESGSCSHTGRHLLSHTANYGLEPHTPGTHYAYNNQAFHFLGTSLQTRYFNGQSPERILEETMLGNIGHEDPVNFTGQWGGWDGGFHLSARDLARCGLLVLRGGKWRGKQILCKDFTAALFQPQIPPDAVENLAKGPNDEWNQHHLTTKLKGRYSFGWWLNGVKDGKARSIRMRGRGGNLLIVVPGRDLVISVTNNRPETAPDSDVYLDAVDKAVL